MLQCREVARIYTGMLVYMDFWREKKAHISPIFCDFAPYFCDIERYF